MLTGLTGGFFLLALTAAERKRTKLSKQRTRRTADRDAMATPLCSVDVLKSIICEQRESDVGHKRLPWASKTSTSPNRAACDSIWARSPAKTICRLAESKYFRAVASTSSEVRPRTLAR